jgi:hypothetical protein
MQSRMMPLKEAFWRGWERERVTDGVSVPEQKMPLLQRHVEQALGTRIARIEKFN